MTTAPTDAAGPGAARHGEHRPPWRPSDITVRFGGLTALSEVSARGRARAASSAWSGPTAPASRPSSPCCPGSSGPTHGRGVAAGRGRDQRLGPVAGRQGLGPHLPTARALHGVDRARAPGRWPTVPGWRHAGSGGTCSTPARSSRPRAAENERVDGLLELLQAHQGGQGAGGGAAAGRGPPRRGGPGPGQRAPRPPARRAPLRTRPEQRRRTCSRSSGGSSPRATASSRWSSSSTTWPRSWPCRTRSSSSTSGSASPSGSPEEIRNDPAVRAAYLGDGDPPQRSVADSPPAPKDSRARRARAGMTEPLLQAQNLDVRYGPSQALFGVSIDVAAGDGAGRARRQRRRQEHARPCRLGPGGTGRRSGDCSTGTDITGLPAHRIRRLGLTYVPEGRGHLPRPVGHRQPADGGGAGAPQRAGGRHRPGRRAVSRCSAPGRSQRAGSLSGGEQQMLALARALAVSPKLIIADELSLGLAPLITESVFKSLEEARRSGITIVLSEQFVHRALSMADSCVILTRGRVGWSGPASEAGHEVIDRYLGRRNRRRPRWRPGGWVASAVTWMSSCTLDNDRLRGPGVARAGARRRRMRPDRREPGRHVRSHVSAYQHW